MIIRSSMMKRTVVLFVVLTLIAVIAGCASKKESAYPEKQLTLIVAAGAGGGADIAGRLAVSYWEKILKQPFVVSNKPGAGGAIGSREIAQAKPDGYSLGITSYPDSTTQIGVLGKEAGYKTDDFALIGSLTRTPVALCVRKDGPFKDLQSFVEYAKNNPGKVSVAVPGLGQKLAMILLEEKYGIKLKVVMFKSGGDAMNQCLGGHTMAAAPSSNFGVQYADMGETLVLSGETKIAALPRAATFKELGIDTYIEMARIFVAPKDTPPAILSKLRSTLKQVTSNQEFIDKLKATGEEYGPMFDKELEDYYTSSNTKLLNLINKNKDRLKE